MADKIEAKREEDDDLAPTITPGYKPAAAKTLEEYSNLDANDESLKRWKESLGLGAAPSGDTSEPMLTVSSLALIPTEGESIEIDFTANPQRDFKKDPIQVKEGAEYKATISFEIKHSIVTGLRYIQVTKTKIGVRVDKVDEMIGSYGVGLHNDKVVIPNDQFPSGMMARGTYNVTSKVIDFDGHEYLNFNWCLKIAKDW